MRRAVYPGRRTGIAGTENSLESHNQTLPFSGSGNGNTGVFGQTRSALSSPPGCPELCPFPEHTAPLNVETMAFSFHIRPVDDWLCDMEQITSSSCIGIRF